MTFKLPRLLLKNSKWLETQQSSILSAATIISVASMISALSKLFVQRALISSFFSTAASQEALEAFWFAFQIPDMMFQLIILGALSAAFIPIFTSQKKKNLARAFTMSSIMMNVLLLVFLVVSVLVFIFAEPLTLLRTGDEFTPHQIEIVINLTRIMLLAQFFFAISNFLTGILQSFQRFVLPAIAPILYNLGILAGVFLFADSFGIYSAGMGVVIGAFAHMMIQLPLVLKLGFRYQPTLHLRFPGIQEFFKLMPPRVMAIGASEARKLLLGFFATSIGNLSYLMMQLGLTLMAIPIRFFGVSISQASLPFLSEESSDQDLEKFKGLVLQSLHQIAFLTFPASVLLIILRVPIVRLIFGTENFPWSTTVTTSWILGVLAISVTVQAMVHLLIRAFYALKDTKTPLLIAGADVVLYLLLSFAMITFFPYKDVTNKVFGLAIATTTTAFIEFLFFLFFLDRKVAGFARKAFWVPQIKMVTASFFMAVFLYLPYRIFDELIFDTSKTVELIALSITTGTIGMSVYIYFTALLEIKELKMITNLIYTFDKWPKPLLKIREILVETSVETDDA
jgi:putative peptidoglycan lipid II flippase